MSKQALVSVIIPSYNHAQYISEAINSVLNQTYENFELIIVDDGSSDDSHQLLNSYKMDSRIKVILNKENRGQSAVVNQALSIAKGDYIALLPSDDYYLPAKLALQIAKFNECDSDVGVVYGRGARFFPDSNETIPVNLPMYRGWVLEDLIKWGNFVYPVTPLFRREVFEEFKPDERYKAEGEAIYFKIAIKYKFDYVDELVAVMRDHNYNTGKNTLMMLNENERYFREFFSRNDLPDRVARMSNIPLLRLYRTKALELTVSDECHASLILSCVFKCFRLKGSYLLDAKLWAAMILGFFPCRIKKKLLTLKN